MKKDYTGLSLVVKGNRIFMENLRGTYTKVDVTPVYHFFKEFFTTDWRKKGCKKRYD